MATLSQAYLEWERETELRGELRGEQALILRLLNRKIGELPESVQSQVQALSIAQLEELGEMLLDFSALVDLQNWLARQE